MAKRISVKGKGADIFFGDYARSPAADVAPMPPTPLSTPSPESAAATNLSAPAPSPTAPKQSRKRSSTLASTVASPPDPTQASVLASTLARERDTVIESIRRTVKVPGREVSFVRLTPQEKRELTDLVYAYKRQGRKTSENEINRIAVNFILEDYKANSAQSILARVIDALLA